MSPGAFLEWAGVGEVFEAAGGLDHAPRFYDRKADPDQRRDVFKEHRDVARRLHRKLIAEMRRLGAGEDWVRRLDARNA